VSKFSVSRLSLVNVRVILDPRPCSLLLLSRLQVFRPFTGFSFTAFFKHHDVK